jgi:hypothetical protein
MWCKECGRYLQPPKHWVRAEPESKELLTFCTKRIKGLTVRAQRAVRYLGTAGAAPGDSREPGGWDVGGGRRESCNRANGAVWSVVLSGQGVFVSWDEDWHIESVCACVRYLCERGVMNT